MWGERKRGRRGEEIRVEEEERFEFIAKLKAGQWGCGPAPKDLTIITKKQEFPLVYENTEDKMVTDCRQENSYKEKQNRNVKRENQGIKKRFPSYFIPTHRKERLFKMGLFFILCVCVCVYRRVISWQWIDFISYSISYPKLKWGRWVLSFLPILSSKFKIKVHFSQSFEIFS